MTVQSEKWCDLHCHTNCSDGSDTPEELIQKARQAGLAAVAVTDHDTVEGLEVAVAAGGNLGIEVIEGVELSVFHEPGNFHLLGYLGDWSDPAFMDVLGRVQEARRNRNPKVVEKLKGLGVEISMAELEEMAQGGQVGRPHFARLLVEKGYVSSVHQAFDRYLKKGGPAYVPKSVLKPEEAIRGVRACGGVAVLAHPFSLGHRDLGELRRWVEEWREMGLQGVECYYSEHDPAFTQFLIEMCRSLGLAVTGGSDYHGKAKPHIALGRGRGDLRIPYSCVEEIRERCSG